MRRVATLTALAVASAALAVTGAGAAQAADRAVVLTHGHIDLFEVSYDQGAGGLRLQVKDDTGIHAAGSVYRDPADVTIAVDADEAALTVPEGLPASYSFLGAPGDVVYDLPQSQNTALPWPGWSTERLTSTLPAGTTLAAGQPVELSVDVEGPGEVHSFMNGATGEAVNHYVDSSDGGPDVIPVAASAHVHTEWVFTEQGDYTFEVTPSARTQSGTTITGSAATYHVRVGEPSALGLEVTPNKAGATYLYGQGITLDAAPTAATGLDHYHWFVKRAGEPAYSISSRSSTAQLKLPTSLVWDGAQVYANLYDDDHQVVATSEPLTLHVSALPEVTALSAHTDKTRYAVGDVAQLSSTQSPETGEDHFHWYVKKPGEEFYTYIPGSDQATATLPLTAEHDGASVLARIFDHDHAVIAESDPVLLRVGDGAEAPAATTLRLQAPARQVYGATAPATVQVSVTAAAADGADGADGATPGAGTVQVTAGSVVLADGVALDAAGTAKVRLPRTLAVGTHALSATFTPADATAQTPATAPTGRIVVAKAPARATVKLAAKKVRASKRAKATVRVRLPQSVGVVPDGRVVVRVDGRKVAVGKVRDGKVTVRLPRLKPGKHRVQAVYRGSATTAKATATRVVLTVRR